MISLFTIGVGAGLVSALLFTVQVTGALLAVLLAAVAPVPVLIAALGWNHRCGLVATAAGALAIAVALSPEIGFLFAIGSALPAWWLAYLALLGRSNPDGTLEWYPLGRLLMWIAASAALVTLVRVLVLFSWDYGTYRDAMTLAVEAIARRQTRTPADMPLPPIGGTGGIPAEQYVALLVTSVPVFVAAASALMLTLNLWVSAKVVSVSQRLPRPWPVIAATAMPRSSLALAAAAVAVAALMPGYGRLAALALAGGLAMAFALQGLALLHDLTRGSAGRVVMLVGAYLLMVPLFHTVLPLLALVGVADTAIGLRRGGRTGGGPRPTIGRQS